MRIFDLHSDILYDLYAHYPEAKQRFLEYHLPRLKISPLKGGIWTLYSPAEFSLPEALEKALAGIDLSGLPDYDVIFGLEGLRNLKIEDFDRIYELGIQHAMLTWNEENIYATGVRGPQNRGLTALGKTLVAKMVEKNMIIDLAHLNEKSFDDVLDYTNKNIIFSHGNLREICDHPRNLNRRQLLRLKEAGGLLGLSLVRYFLSPIPPEQNVKTFLRHLDLAVEVMGIGNVAFGFDFMDYFPGENGNLEEIPDCTKLGLLLETLKEKGYSDEDVERLSYRNFYDKYHHLMRR
jgi:membrane dipeptidase